MGFLNEQNSNFVRRVSKICSLSNVLKDTIGKKNWKEARKGNELDLVPSLRQDEQITKIVHFVRQCSEDEVMNVFGGSVISKDEQLFILPK
jgi:hypothetical protein